MKRHFTREERRRRSNRTLRILTYLCFLALFLIWFFGFMVMTVDASKKERPEHTKATMPEITVQVLENYENELIEEALLARSNKIEDVTVTHYCTCSTCCGWSTGITASGRVATPGVSVAVDPDVIPLGADVLVDYGDGEINYYRADDTGSGVGGNHIDLCMESHEAALQAGVKTATVWWVMP